MSQTHRHFSKQTQSLLLVEPLHFPPTFPHPGVCLFGWEILKQQDISTWVQWHLSPSVKLCCHLCTSQQCPPSRESKDKHRDRITVPWDLQPGSFWSWKHKKGRTLCLIFNCTCSLQASLSPAPHEHVWPPFMFIFRPQNIPRTWIMGCNYNMSK